MVPVKCNATYASTSINLHRINFTKPGVHRPMVSAPGLKMALSNYHSWNKNFVELIFVGCYPQ